MSDALSYFGDPSTEETQKFVLIFDKFFDCLNVRSLDEWAFKRKDDLKPYYSPTDVRFKVSNYYLFLSLFQLFIVTNSGLRMNF